MATQVPLLSLAYALEDAGLTDQAVARFQQLKETQSGVGANAREPDALLVFGVAHNQRFIRPTARPKRRLRHCSNRPAPMPISIRP